MQVRLVVLQLLAVILTAGCATGKTIKTADDIGDDGKRNVVLLTHDLKAYVTNKYSSVSQTSLVFRCPAASEKLRSTCFTVTLPYLGTKEINGFGMHAFESTGASALKMKYNRYSLQSVMHNVVIDKVPDTYCYYSRKAKKTLCDVRVEDKVERHAINFPSPTPINVDQGPGCYIGHLSLSMANNQIVEFNLDTETPLSEERLTKLPADVATKLMQTANRPCV